VHLAALFDYYTKRSAINYTYRKLTEPKGVVQQAARHVDEYSIRRLEDMLHNVKIVVRTPGVTEQNLAPMVREFNYHVRVLGGVEIGSPAYERIKLRLREDPNRGFRVYRGREIDVD
jgi:chaperonin GroEL (HSP60 family)